MSHVEKKLEVTVRLMGKATELIKANDPCNKNCRELKVQVNDVTPRSIINEIAKQNPLLRDQIVRRDGTPRSSTKILINGQPPSDLDMELTTRRVKDEQTDIIIVVFPDEIIIIVIVPCDG